MFLQSKKLRKLLRKWPGANIFGIFRFLPAFYIFGAAIEFSMINWKVGEVNFYRTYKRRQVEEIVDKILLEEQEAINASG